jgi:hypothetical protein|nr:MAG TPA: hypothetical protein [Caudoviricetes sp.]
MEMNDRPPFNKAWLWVILIMIIGAIVFVALHWNVGEVKNLFSKEEVSTESVQPETVVIRDTITMPTVEDVLLAREVTKEQHRKDSVFMQMPKAALAAVLMKIGTNSTIKEIVEEYESNISIYSNVILGAEIQDKILQPDSLRPKPAT